MTNVRQRMNFLVLSKETVNLPTPASTVSISKWNTPDGVVITDRSFNRNRIVLLIIQKRMTDFIRRTATGTQRLSVGLSCRFQKDWSNWLAGFGHVRRLGLAKTIFHKRCIEMNTLFALFVVTLSLHQNLQRIWSELANQVISQFVGFKVRYAD